LLQLSSKYYASHLLSNNVEIKIEITIILTQIFCRYETAAQSSVFVALYILPTCCIHHQAPCAGGGGGGGIVCWHW